MNQKEFIKILHESLLKQNEFNLFKSNKSYYKLARNDNKYIYSYKLIVHSYSPIYPIVPGGGIICKSINNIYSSFRAQNKAEIRFYKNHFPTLGGDIARITDAFEIENIPNEVRLNCETNNTEVIDFPLSELVNIFNIYIEPFFIKFSSVNAIDNYLNTDLGKVTLLKPAIGERGALGLIAAKLNHNPNLNSLIESYSEMVKKSNSSKAHVDAFNKCIEWLKLS